MCWTRQYMLPSFPSLSFTPLLLVLRDTDPNSLQLSICYASQLSVRPLSFWSVLSNFCFCRCITRSCGGADSECLSSRSTNWSGAFEVLMCANPKDSLLTSLWFRTSNEVPFRYRNVIRHKFHHTRRGPAAGAYLRKGTSC